MADNSQTTDPMAPENQQVQYDEFPDCGQPEAEEVMWPTVRDPGKGNNGGANLWKGSQASDF
jgi:hypothetical protein